MKIITIKPALNGWIVKVGCSNKGTVLFIDKKALLNEIDRYIDNPEKVEAEYLKYRINKTGSEDLRETTREIGGEIRPKRETE